MAYDYDWFIMWYPHFENGVPQNVVDFFISQNLEMAKKYKKCGLMDKYLATAVAKDLSERGYPTADTSIPPVVSNSKYDQVVKRHTVGDVTTEFEVIDNSKADDGSLASSPSYGDILEDLRKQCFGGIRGLSTLIKCGGCGCD